MRELSYALKPLSVSMKDEEYSKFLVLVASIESIFKFNCIDFDRRLELRDYIIPSLNYINKHMILVNSDDMLECIDAFVDLVEHINDAIIEKNCKVICQDLEYDMEKFDLIYFTYLWTSLTTNMLVRLKYNYGWVRKKVTTSIQGCCCNCNDCPCKDSCPCCNCLSGDDNQSLDYRPIQESYYTKWDTADSYLERW